MFRIGGTLRWPNFLCSGANAGNIISVQCYVFLIIYCNKHNSRINFDPIFRWPYVWLTVTLQIITIFMFLKLFCVSLRSANAVERNDRSSMETGGSTCLCFYLSVFTKYRVIIRSFFHSLSFNFIGKERRTKWRKQEVMDIKFKSMTIFNMRNSYFNALFLAVNCLWIMCPVIIDNIIIGCCNNFDDIIMIV